MSEVISELKCLGCLKLMCRFAPTRIEVNMIHSLTSGIFKQRI